MNKINSCEVCGNNELAPVLDLGSHPMCDDLIPVGDARVCREYPIKILFCRECLTAHQQFQVPKRELFPDSYHYRSRFTADVLLGMKGLVSACEQQFGKLAGKKVLDIGCNDGSLLDLFRTQGAQTFGIEPTGACVEAAEKGHQTVKGFFSQETASILAVEYGRPDFITFTNVFAHIEDLREVLVALKLIMKPDTVIVIENHYLGAVLSGNQFDTFYHEHPRTYSCSSFRHIAKALGVSVLNVEFPSRYGGNIRVFLGGGSEKYDQAVRTREYRFGEEFKLLGEKVELWKIQQKDRLLGLVQTYGKLRAKAFPGRAAILIKLLGLDENHLSAVYEKPGSLKIGHYVPGTRIPIRSDDDLFKLPQTNQALLNLAWHIPTEIRTYLADHNYKGSVIDIL